VSALLLASALCAAVTQCGDVTGPVLSERQIAFIGRVGDSSDVFLVNADGTGLTNLTDAPSNYTALTWSSTGSRIAVTRWGSDLVVLRASNGARWELPIPLDWGSIPSWAPDGSRLAFESGDDIYVIGADGAGLTQLTDGLRQDYGPEWAPDGLRIVFTGYSSWRGDVLVINADGTGLTNLTNSSDYESAPAWSPDGSRIAFVRQSADSRGVHVMNADGTGVLSLMGEAAWGQYSTPIWSPDGRRVAFLFDPPRDHPDDPLELYVANADGSGLVNVSNDGAREDCPAWAPDAIQIAYLIRRSDRFGEIRMAGSPGLGVSNLTGDPPVDQCPVWSPDGEWLATVSYLDRFIPGVITTMRSDGSSRRVVTITVDAVTEVRWGGLPSPLPQWRPIGGAP